MEILYFQELHLQLFTIQNVSIKSEKNVKVILVADTFTIQNVSIKSLSSSNYLYSIPSFLIFVDTNIFIYFYQEFLFIFL